MGLPFVFSLTTPTLLHVRGCVQAHAQPGPLGNSFSSQLPFASINTTADIRFVYSVRSQSQIGFVTPFNHQHYVAGASKNFQINLPIRTNMTLDFLNRKISARVETFDRHEKQNLMEYSTIPFTAKRDILRMVDNPQEQIQNNANSSIVHFSSPKKIHQTVGLESTGVAFDLDYHNEEEDFNVIETFQKYREHQGCIYSAVLTLADKSIALKNITLAFNPEKTTAEYAEFTAAFFDDSNHVEESSDNEEIHDGKDPHVVKNLTENFAEVISLSLDTKSRQRQFLKSAMNGIQDSAAMVIDLTAEFQGQSRSSFTATFAAATSFPSPKARYLFFADVNPANRNKNQVCWAIETTTPNVPLMNFNDSINSDPTSSLEAQLYFGERCDHVSSKVVIKGKMERSLGRKRYVRESPLGQLCESQMKDGNLAQHACQTATRNANSFDQYRFSVAFQKIPGYWKDATYKAYGLIRHAAYQYLDEDLISQNKLDIEANFSHDLEYLNVSIHAPVLSAMFTNIRVDKCIQPIVVVHPEYSASQRFAEYAFSGQHFSTCVVDSNQAETFDNKSYPLNLGNCWHVMFHYDPSIDSISDNADGISVLVRDSSSYLHKKDVAVLVGEDSIGLEVTTLSGCVRVTVNGQIIPISKDRLSQIQDKDGNIIAFAYSLPTETIRLFFISDVEIQFDGVAVKIRANNKYRSTVHGLCGTFTSQPTKDLTTPRGSVLQSPAEFAATYALINNSCRSPTIKDESYNTVSGSSRETNTTLIPKPMKSPPDITPKPTSKSGSRSQLRRKNTQKPLCSQKYVRTVDKEGKRCVSLTPQIQCYKRCSKQKSVKKQVEFECPDSHTLQEASLEFGRKKLNKSFMVNIPENCSLE